MGQPSVLPHLRPFRQSPWINPQMFSHSNANLGLQFRFKSSFHSTNCLILIQSEMTKYIKRPKSRYKYFFLTLSKFHTIQCNVLQCNAMQCNVLHCNAMQCNAMQYNAMQCNAMQCNHRYRIHISRYETHVRIHTNFEAV